MRFFALQVINGFSQDGYISLRKYILFCHLLPFPNRYGWTAQYYLYGGQIASAEQQMQNQPETVISKNSVNKQ